MEINCWGEQGVGQRIRPIRGRDAAVIRAAIHEARSGERTGDAVLWRQDRVSATIRTLARMVLGFGSTVVVGLLVALAVVSADTRQAVLFVLVPVVVLGGGFVWSVWTVDVGIEIRANGRLVRAGWSGVDEYDLRTYRRVTVDERGGGSGVDAAAVDGE